MRRNQCTTPNLLNLFHAADHPRVLSGEVNLHGPAKRHDICHNLIRVWVEK